MPDIGVPELLIVAFIVILLFGPSKAADLGGSLGKSIREFRKASREEGEPGATALPPLTASSSNSEIASASDPAAGVPAAGGTGRFCTECGTRLQDGQRFCTNCGAPAVVAAG